ncbi:MAG: hypothetical protein HC767_04845 [Akkermansiaceae bacterium]|nr:hypothetical protein [Akkermansiaceae bacterium]
MDNLYLRALFRNNPADAQDREHVFIALGAVAPYAPAPSTATRYMTNMTFQGDNNGSTVGVFGDESTYVEGLLQLCTRLRVAALNRLLRVHWQPKQPA